jgi:tetratricopeptide (TPR) repeat protein
VNLIREQAAVFERIEKLIQVGRLGAARRLVDGLRQSHGPMLWGEVRNRFDTWMRGTQAEGGSAVFPVETSAPIEGTSGGLVRVQVALDGASVDALPEADRANWRAALEAGLRAGGLDPSTQRAGLRFHPDISGRRLLRVEGRSAEIAIAVAACSAARQTPVPALLAFTGSVSPSPNGTDAGLEAPDALSLGLKRATLHDDWGAGARLVTGGGAGSVGEAHANLSGLLAAVFGAKPAAAPRLPRLADRFAQLAPLERAGQYADAMQVAESVWSDRKLLPGPQAVFGVALEGLRLANHLADERAFAHWRERAESVEHAADPRQLATFAANVGVQTIDTGDPECALAALEFALHVLPARLPPDLERVQVLGTLARALSACGEHDRAIAFGDAALAFAPPSERPRNNGDAAFWRLRAGRAAEALEVLDAGEAEREEVETAYDIAVTVGFRALCRTRVLIALGRLDEARQARNEILRGPKHLVLTLGAAETGVALGVPVGVALDGLDLSPPVLSRWRARIEYAQPKCDLAAATEWARGFSRSELELKVPY